MHFRSISPPFFILALHCIHSEACAGGGEVTPPSWQSSVPLLTGAMGGGGGAGTLC